jgi:hypothetical protein
MPKVDMSPEAVTERLRLMGELCELAMRSSQPKIIDSAECDSENSLPEPDEDRDRIQDRER